MFADCHLVLDIRGSSVRRLLDALDHFDGCKSVDVRGDGMGPEYWENNSSAPLTDSELFVLLHSDATRVGPAAKDILPFLQQLSR